MSRYGFNRWQDDEPTADQHAEMLAQLADDFYGAIKAGDADATPEWTGTVIDYAEAKRLGLPYNEKAPRKRRTVEAVFAESMDYESGPQYSDLVKLLHHAMHSSDPLVKAFADDLVNRCADVWARMNVD